VALGALCLILATPRVGSATLVISEGLIPSLSNVNLVSATDVTTVTGNTSNAPVVSIFFTTTSNTHLDAKNGLASISGTTGTLSNLTATFQPGYGATEYDFAVQQLAGDTKVTVTATDQFGTSFNKTFDATASGDNKYNITAADGQLITIVTWSVAAGGADSQTNAKQYRVDVAQSTAVPEPSTIALAISALMPLGIMGLRSHRRRSDTRAA